MLRILQSKLTNLEKNGGENILEKVQLLVFMPVGVCGCSQTTFLGRIYGSVKKYREYIDYKEYSTESELAKQFNISFRGVVVGERSLGSNPTQSSIEGAILKEIEKQGIKIAS